MRTSLRTSAFFLAVACCGSAAVPAVAALPYDAAAAASDTVAGAGDTLSLYPPERFTYAGDRRWTMDGSPPLARTSIRPVGAAITGGVYFGVIGAMHVYQVNTIWKDNSSFRFIEDGEYALYTDKGGHFVGSYFISYSSREALMGAGLSVDAAANWGAVMGLAYMTYVEVMDGYGTNWGFSPSDMYANLAGIGFFWAQNHVPALEYFTPKATILPSSWQGFSKRPFATSVIDDYSAWTWWLSVDVHGLLPQGAKAYWPDWLSLSLGYAARNLDSPEASRKWIVGLDYNMVRLIPDGPPIVNWIRQTLNHIKLPAPAVEFSPDGPPVFKILYPVAL